MGRIQSNTGLVTGMQIGSTVDSLMALAARPRDNLAKTNDSLKQEQVAITELTALLLAVRYVSDNLGKQSVFESAKATSSDPATLTAGIEGSPAAGVHYFTPVRMAERHQVLSAGLASPTASLGSGAMTFRFGSDVERSADLESFGAGGGFRRGKIRITDRGGHSAEIDLTAVRTLDDVLDAINRNTAINVTAEGAGDRIRLVDHTGQSVSNLIVQEVGRGTTAASLGLAGINAAADTSDGSDVLQLAQTTPLDALNDGNGVRFSPVLPDLLIRLRDGSAATVDLAPIKAGSSEVLQEVTLGEVLKKINEAGQGKLKAEIAPDGDRLMITDLTQGSDPFAVESLYDSQALKSLGLDRAAVDGVLTGRRILGGTKSVLLSSLNGGRGLGQLGVLQLTDRSGASASVDLSAAETLEDVIRSINGAGLGIGARVNDARNGILLSDATGASTSNLIVASSDNTGTAEILKMAVNAAATSVNSGDLHLQTVSWNTKLSDYNGGAGVARGHVTITDSTGRLASLDLTRPEVQTVGDVIRAINRLNLRISADLNETGDGILIRDLDRQQAKLQVRDVDSTAAADLHLLGGSVERVINNQLTQVVDGSTTFSVSLNNDEGLQDLVRKVQNLGVGVEAAVLKDSSSTPYRLSLASTHSGERSRLVVDASGLGLSLEEMVRGRDALLAVSQPGGSGLGLLLNSPTNRFRETLPGLNLEVKQASEQPVAVSVEKTDSELVSNVKAMVENYNRFRKKLNEHTKYDSQNDTRAPLTGDATALRLDVDLSGFLSGRFFGAGSIGSLGELGIKFKDDGTIDYDESKLKARFAADPDAVKQFFTKDKTGFAAKFKTLSEGLTGMDVSLLAQRYESLDRKIRDNNAKISMMDTRLESQRNRLYLDFYRMELAVGKMKIQLSALDALKPIETSQSSSTSSG